MAVFKKWRGSTLAAGALGMGLVALLLVLLDAGRLAASRSAHRQPVLALARALQLTDPSLFTEARYARHLSQADRHAAFQDHPMALEHFPAGAMVPPPSANLDPGHEHLD
jgi:hypothetical protein